MTTILIRDDHAKTYAEAMRRAQPGFRYLTATSEGEAIAQAPEAEIIVGLAPFITREMIAAAPKLVWIQALTTGVDNLLRMGLSDGVVLTKVAGIHGPQMSELAILSMLALQRRYPEMLRNQTKRSWVHWKQPLLADKTACILGLGAISETMAPLLRAFGMTVTGVSGRSEAPGVARIFARERLAEAVAEADFLIVLVPYGPDTHHIVDAEILRAMRPGSYLVNLARGGCVDEDALAEALAARTIAGAALDVFAIEPLPEDAAIWDAPNLIITPHVGGAADVYAQQAIPTILRNLDAYVRGGTDALPDKIERPMR